MGSAWSVRISFLLLFAASLLLAACSQGAGRRDPAAPPDSFASWQANGMEYPPLDQAPESLRSLKPVRWTRVRYANPYSGAKALVDAFWMPTDASAFEAQQKWRNEPGRVAMHKGRLFAVISSSTEPTQSLVEFSRQLEIAWTRNGL